MTIVMNMPEKIGKYRVTGILGEGVSGVVYKAFDPALQRVVAVKSLHRGVPADARAARAFAARLREQTQALSRLTHASIAAIHEIDESGGRAFVAMEHVAGPNLAQWLATTPMPSQAVVAQIMDQLLDALESAHQVGVRHGDVKASNIVVTGSGLIKLTDFGLARAEARTGALAGSAPEYASGRLLDHRVDIYGAGAVLYRMLVGRDPFPDMPVSLADAAVLDPARAPSTIAEAHRRAAFDAVVGKAMAHDPNQRYETAADFRAALRDATQARLSAHDHGVVSLDSNLAQSSHGQHATLMGEAAQGGDPRAVRRPLMRSAPGAAASANAPVLKIAIPDSVLAMPSFDPWANPGAGLPAMGPGDRPESALAADAAPQDDAYAAFRGQVDRERRASVISAATAANAILSAAADAAGASDIARVRRPPPDPSRIPTLLPQSDALAPLASTIAHEPAPARVPQPLQTDLELPMALPGEGIPAEALRRVLRVLSAHFGEIAGDVLKQVGANATTIAELHTLLLERAGAHVDKKTLAKQLRAVAKLPL